MFNDSVQMGFFDVYDQYILNILYDPRIKAGMTLQEVKAVLPRVMIDVRAFVSTINALPLYYLELKYTRCFIPYAAYQRSLIHHSCRVY